MKETIACLGAGRMGRGIAVVFAYAGHRVALVDFKARDDGGVREAVERRARRSAQRARHAGELRPVRSRAHVDGTDGARVRRARKPARRPRSPPPASSSKACRKCSTSSARRWRAHRSSPGPTPIIASTTSTILVDDLSSAVEHPERFLNAHWLNPAFLVPLVEVSPGKHTDPAVTARVKALLESVGKVPVVCAARPGYIVPRIQALAMNEAARMVEEGVASAEDLDKAIKYGFGIRFAVLGMLEFIDWGGGDILYYASRYLTGALGSERYAAPDIVERNMAEGRTGLRTGAGFLNYEGLDVEAYRRERLKAFVELLGHFGLNRPPVL